MTYQPSHTSAGAVCVDSSGVVTSAAVYHMRGELAREREEKEKLRARLKKFKEAFIENKELYEEGQ